MGEIKVGTCGWSGYRPGPGWKERFKSKLQAYSEAFAAKARPLPPHRDGLDRYEGSSGRIRRCPGGVQRRYRSIELRMQAGEITNFVGIIGRDPKMVQIYRQIRDLGGLSLKGAMIETPEGIKACQDYGMVICQKFNN